MRGVELIAVPQTHINDLYCEAQLSDDLGQGILNTHISLSGKQKNPKIEIVVMERGIEGLPITGKEVYRQEKQIEPVESHYH